MQIWCRVGVAWGGLRPQIRYFLSVESLEFHPQPLEISHKDVGKYFKVFHKSHYLANDALAELYPEDTAFTCQSAADTYSDISVSCSDPR